MRFPPVIQHTLLEKKGIPLCPVCLGNRVKMGNGGPLWCAIVVVSFGCLLVGFLLISPLLRNAGARLQLSDDTIGRFDGQSVSCLAT